MLVSAGLVLRSLHRLSHVPLGFDPGQLLIASFDLDRQRYSAERGAAFQAKLRTRLAALPGVRSVSFGQHAPFDTEMSMNGDVSAEGQPVHGNTQYEFTPCEAVDENYFATTGMTVIDGRGFTVRDDAGRSRVAVISLAQARKLWPNQSAVGRRLIVNQQQPPIEVVGVLGDGRFWNLTASAQRYVFFPLAQRYSGRVRLLVRTEADPLGVAPAVERTIHELDPDLPVFGVRTMRDQIAQSPNALAPMRIGAAVAAAQGSVALVLATLGMFGLISFAAARRTREVGIRVALGARFGDIMRLIARDAFRLVAIGLAVGLLLSLALTRVLSRVLYGTSPLDALVFVVVPLVVLAAAALACWLPARRAGRVDPMVALRCD